MPHHIKNFSNRQENITISTHPLGPMIKSVNKKSFEFQCPEGLIVYFTLG
jgi:hypothetical protein